MKRSKSGDKRIPKHLKAYMDEQKVEIKEMQARAGDLEGLRARYAHL